MKKITLFFSIALLICSLNLFSQNTLWLTNGKQLKIGEYKMEQNALIKYQSLKGKNKTMDPFEIFSILDSTGKEKIIYKPDSSYQGAFTIEEMRSFVKGQYDADQKFKSPLSTIGGIAVAGASSVFINPVYVFVVSGVYSTGMGLSGTPKKKLQIPAEYANNDHYLLGYKKSCKHKRTKNAIIGSAIGLAVGLGTFAIINKN